MTHFLFSEKKNTLNQVSYHSKTTFATLWGRQNDSLEIETYSLYILNVFECLSIMISLFLAIHPKEPFKNPFWQDHYLGILTMDWFDNIVFDDVFNFNILNFFSCSFNSWSRCCFNKVSEFLVMLVLKLIFEPKNRLNSLIKKMEIFENFWNFEFRKNKFCEKCVLENYFLIIIKCCTGSIIRSIFICSPLVRRNNFLFLIRIWLYFFLLKNSGLGLGLKISFERWW